MTVKINGIGAFAKEMKQALAELESEAVQEVAQAMPLISKEMMKRTPVWTGESVRNYTWQKGDLATGPTKAPLGGAPERTNDKALGTENNRGINEAAALASIPVVTGGKLTNVTLTNTIDDKKWDLIDNGSAPTTPGLTPRNPGGVSKIAIQSARRKLENFK